MDSEQPVHDAASEQRRGTQRPRRGNSARSDAGTAAGVAAAAEEVMREASRSRAGARSCPPRSGLVQWRFFEAQKRHLSLLGAGASKHKPLIWPLLCRPTLLAPESKKNVGRHFSGEDFGDVTRRGRLRPDATNLRTCGRHGDAAQTATLPWRGMSHYLELKAVRQGGLRRPQLAFRPRTTDDWQQTTEHRRRDRDYGLAVPKKSTRTNYAVYL